MPPIDISTAEEKEFSDTVLRDFKISLYHLGVEQSFDIARVKRLESDPKTREKIAELDTKIADLLSKKKTLFRPNDVTKLEGEIEQARFFKSKLTMPIQRCYEGISERAQKIKGVLDMVDAIRNFQYHVQEELPYAVIDGTRYAMKNNVIQRDDLGNYILYLGKVNGKENSAKAN